MTPPRPRTPLKAKPTTAIPKHVHVAAGTTNKNGQPDCAHCNLPYGHAVHQLPSTTPDAKAIDAAVLGERIDD